MYCVEFIMLKYGLITGPYFAGLSLVMVTSTMLFPLKLRYAFVVYSLCVLPVFAWIIFQPLPETSDTLSVVLMLLGSVLVCSINSGQVHSDMRTRFLAVEDLARDLGVREKEIRKKAEELLKRRIFESQFSPQVVSAVLANRLLVKEMKRYPIVNIVTDIENSTQKANLLSPSAYKEVVEEVLDVFSAACLKWNITLDKFTGDGVQAFVGAPMSSDDDLTRAVMACRDCMTMLSARKAALELLWKTPLNVRFAICQGESLVGFIGRGSFKSYTAVGDMVSFTHRLSAVPAPWTIALHQWQGNVSPNLEFLGFKRSSVEVTDLKGFGDRKFNIHLLTPEISADQASDAGRCPDCETPLVLEEGLMGLPRVYCPGCQARAKAA
jgi:class 3 adenylate cyclase